MAASLCLRRGPAVLHPLLAPRAPLPVPFRGRKSRTDSPAKSKAGRLKVPPPVCPEELLVVKARYQHYRAVVVALRAEFKEEVQRKLYEEKTGSLAAERLKQETEQHRMLMAWNDAENARLRRLREERFVRDEAEEKQLKLQAAIDEEVTQRELMEERELEILQLQEEAKHFITPENLDQRIEEALDNPKSYNFAVDKEGRVAKRTVLP